MKSANTKEIKRFAKEISQDSDLVEELGIEYNMMKVQPLYDFSEELQLAYDETKDKEKFLRDLRKAVKDEILELLTAKKVSTITLVKYYFIFTEAELHILFTKYTALVDNIKRLIIIDQIEKILINTVQTDDEDRRVAKAVNKIYRSL